MSIHSNHLSRPMRDRVPEGPKAPQEAILPVDLLELLTRYLKGRQQALYRLLLRDDPQTTVSLDSPDSLPEVLGRLKEVEKLTTEIETIKKGLSLANQVIVLIGSANQPRTYENPWTWEERAMMVHQLGGFKFE